MIVFKIIYLVLTLLVTFGIVKALTDNWKNYAKSQKFYMIGFLIILAAMTQTATTQLADGLDFTYRSGIILVGLLVILVGMSFGRDARLRQQLLEVQNPEDFEYFLKILQRSREMDEEVQKDLDKVVEVTD